MNKHIVRLGAGFVVLVGLAYIGHHVFVQPGDKVTAAASPSSAAPASVAASAPVLAAAAPTPASAIEGPAGGSRAYAVYPDRATEKLFKLDYPTFKGNFSQDVTITPLPPHFAGNVMLRLLPGQAQAVEVALDDPRCASSVQVALYRIDDRKAIATATLTAKQAVLSLPLADGQVPEILAEISMDKKAKNNYWCSVTIRWKQTSAS